MIQKINEITGFIKRIISHEGISVKIYIYWGIATILIFGVFGFYPVFKIFLNNTKVLEDMYQNNKALEKKIEELKKAEKDLEIVGNDADILDRYLPNDFEPQTYMVDMATLIGEAGYSLDKVGFNDIKNSRVRMSLGITGKGELNKLVENFESSGKIMQIESINFNVGDRENALTVSVDSFIMERR